MHAETRIWWEKSSRQKDGVVLSAVPEPFFDPWIYPRPGFAVRMVSKGEGADGFTNSQGAFAFRGPDLYLLVYSKRLCLASPESLCSS
jgi:hypothetical protein